MILLLPNMRLYCLPSSFSGEDWRETCQKIDEAVANLGYDLAQESVYLLYDSDPESVFRGEAQCKIGRSVIGPKKSPERPFELIDWKSSPVYSKVLGGKTWDEIFQDSIQIWKSSSQNYKVFILRIDRKLESALSLSITAIFAE